MCSTQWEMPVMPACSLRAPTRYHTQKETTGAECTSFVIRARPFGNECRWKLDALVRVAPFLFVVLFTAGDFGFLSMCRWVLVSLMLKLSPCIFAYIASQKNCLPEKLLG